MEANAAQFDLGASGFWPGADSLHPHTCGANQRSVLDDAEWWQYGWPGVYFCVAIDFLVRDARRFLRTASDSFYCRTPRIASGTPAFVETE